MESFDAEILKSFGGLSFGATETETEKMFGKPDEEQVLVAPDDSTSRVSHYWAKGFTLFFDKAKDGRFCSVEIDSTNPLLCWGINLFNLNEKQIKELFRENGYKDLDEENQSWGEKRISFDDALVDFYFEKGKLVSVNFGVLSSNDIPIIHSN
jgi:hypothetical protein